MDRSRGQQAGGIERIAFEVLERSNVDDCEFLAEDIGESAFRQTAMQRHLAAFKAAHPGIAGNGLGALGSAAGELTASVAHALAEAAMFLFLALRRSQLA